MARPKKYPDELTRIELASAIHDYIEIFHNTRRRHSPLACSPRPNTNTATSKPKDAA